MGQAAQRTTEATGGAPPPAGEAAVRVSLVIPSRNRAALLRDTVASVLSGDRLPDELLVVDQSDAPDPALAALAASAPCPVRYLWTRTVGLSRACNLGIAEARHEVLVFTHDDVHVAPDWLDVLVRSLVAAGPRGVVTGRVVAGVAEVDGGVVPTLIESTEPVVHEGRIARDVLYPLNMALWRRAVAHVGPLDERLGPGTRFPGGEDNDLGFRLLSCGYRIHYVPEAVVRHRAWRSDEFGLRWTYGRGQGGYYAKHFSRRDPFLLRRFLHDVRHHLGRALRTVRRSRRFALGEALYAAGMVAAAGEWVLTERLLRRSDAPAAGADRAPRRAGSGR